MKQEKYWRSRAESNIDRQHLKGEITINKISKVYKEAIDEINQEIDKIMGKYEDMTPIEMKKYLNYKITYDNRKIKRLEALKISIRKSMDKVAKKEIELDDKLFTGIATDTLKKSTKELAGIVGMEISFALVNDDVVNEILKNTWSGMHYSDRVWKNTEALAQKLEEVLLKGVLTGKSNQKMARELRDLTDMGRYATERLVRTEITYIHNNAEIQSMKRVGIEKYKILATKDNRTSKICRAMDGKIFDVDKAKTGVNLPPLHPNCRSTILSII